MPQLATPPNDIKLNNAIPQDLLYKLSDGVDRLSVRSP